MSGDRPRILIRAEADSVLARAINALQRFPVDQPWVLIGGLAVFLRLAQVTRPTADADTVARSQTELLRTFEGDSTVVIAGGQLTFTLPTGTVEVDVMDLNDDPLQEDDERRAFALARRQALVPISTSISDTTWIRLRRFDKSVGAQALLDDEVAATSILAAAISQALE